MMQRLIGWVREYMVLGRISLPRREEVEQEGWDVVIVKGKEEM